MSTAELLDADVLPSEGKTGCLLVPAWDTGHSKIEWDKKDKNDLDATRKYFLELKAKGYTFYRVDPKSGDKGAVIKEFDELAEKIIAVAPMAGG